MATFRKGVLSYCQEHSGLYEKTLEVMPYFSTRPDTLLENIEHSGVKSSQDSSLKTNNVEIHGITG